MKYNVVNTKNVHSTQRFNGREIVRQRRERIKHLADDLPKVAKAYKEFKEGKV